MLCLFDAVGHEPLALIEADQLGRLRTGAATGVAAKHLAEEGASSLGVIGCGRTTSWTCSTGIPKYPSAT